jgi:hypothetical protein
MHHQHHSNIREGLLAGLIGALIVAVWYLVVDLGQGEAFYTSNLLGQVFVRGGSGPADAGVSSPAVLQYFLLHFGWFLLFGLGLAALIHLATRNSAFRMGVWLYLVTGTVFFFGLSYLLTWLSGLGFPVWTISAGTLLGVGSMGIYLWLRHPTLKLQQAPLGDEVKPPPHPPGAPRA